MLKDDVTSTLTNLRQGAVEAIDKQYDQDMKYAYYLQGCRDVMSRSYDYEFRGFKKVPIVDETTAMSWAREIDAKDKLQDMGFRREILEAVLPPIHEDMESYFQAQYVPIWMRFYRNIPDEQPDPSYSFYWHCDAGPSRHLKLLLYLNPAEECGGTTLLLDRFNTNEFKENGYVFCDLTDRLSDLSRLAHLWGMGFNPTDPSPNTGEGVLFEPYNILHKGIWPTKKARYIIQICFIAGKYKWEQSVDRWNLPSNENSWPDIQM